MKKHLRVWVKYLMGISPRWLCRREFNRQVFSRLNERPVEVAFLFKTLAQICPIKVLDVGTGLSALPSLMRSCGYLVTAIDNIRDYWPWGVFNRHYHILNDNITNTSINDRFDLITCVSVLEHIGDADAAVRNMIALLNPQGFLLLTFPFNERSYVHDVYELPGSSYGRGAPFITQSFSRTDLDRWMQNNCCIIVEQEYWQFWEGDHWTVGCQITPPRRVTVSDKHQLSCLLIRRTA